MSCKHLRAKLGQVLKCGTTGLDSIRRLDRPIFRVWTTRLFARVLCVCKYVCTSPRLVDFELQNFKSDSSMYDVLSAAATTTHRAKGWV